VVVIVITTTSVVSDPLTVIVERIVSVPAGTVVADTAFVVRVITTVSVVSDPLTVLVETMVSVPAGMVVTSVEISVETTVCVAAGTVVALSVIVSIIVSVGPAVGSVVGSPPLTGTTEYDALLMIALGWTPCRGANGNADPRIKSDDSAGSVCFDVLRRILKEK